jgi:hypothetical protein
MWPYVEMALAADIPETPDPRVALALATRQGEESYRRGMRIATVGAALVPAGLGAAGIGGLLFASGVGRNEGVMFGGIGMIITGSTMLIAAPPVVNIGLLKARRGLRLGGLDAPSDLPWVALGLFGGTVVAAGVGAVSGDGRADALFAGLFLASYVVTGVAYSQTVQQHHAGPLTWIVPLVGSDHSGLGVCGVF